MTRRRQSTCPLHPSPAGVCPSCLRHRLSSLQPDLRLSPDSRSCHVINPRVSLSSLLDAHSPNPAQSEHLLGFSKSRVCEEVEDENRITMKEHIDFEFQQRRRSTSSRLWTIGTHKLHKWRQKQQPTNNNHDSNNRMHSNVDLKFDPIEKSTVVMRRRSCDTDTRKCSVDEPPRVSLDGYMIARTIPRLAPMLSVIENAMINEQMIMSTIEDFETNSVSESSSSQRRNSFDCSSSGKSSTKHRAPVEIDSALPVAKIVVSGMEAGRMGFDLCEESYKNMGFKNGDSFKRKMLRVLGFKNKSTGDKIGNPIGGKDDVGSFDLYHRSTNIAQMNKSRSVKYSYTSRGVSRFNCQEK